MTSSDAETSDLVSIVIPVYNCAKYLPGCIDSILCQTHPNYEVFLIDDGSTDNSGVICHSYALNDKRLHVVITPNKGPSAARNIGLKMARGEFLFFLDADDLMAKKTLQILISAHRKSLAEVTVGNFQTMKNGISGIGHKGVNTENTLLTKQDIIAYARNYLNKPNKFSLFSYCWGRLFKSSIIRENGLHFDERLHTFEDVAFHFEYLKYAQKVCFINEVVYYHTIYDSYQSATMTISSDPGRMFGFMAALNKIGEFLAAETTDLNIEQAVGHALISLTIIQFVRICGQVNFFNLKTIHCFLSKLIDSRNIRKNLRHYHPSKDESWILPLLMKMKLPLAILLVCQYKARLRYGAAMKQK